MADKILIPKLRARACILHYITQFCLTNIYSDGRRHGGLHGFSDGLRGEAQVRDLVAMSSAPISEWYLAWVIEVEQLSGGKRFLLESIDTGRQGWWSNIGTPYLERDLVAENPEWRWTDKQFGFWDRWRNVCKQRDAYMTLPTRPVFGVGCAVTIGTRTRFGFDEYCPNKTFPDWRKVTKPMLGDFYDECHNSWLATKASVA